MARGRSDRLTPKELILCKHYFKYGDLTAAALYAGFSTTVAKQAHYRILKRPLVKEFIEQKAKDIAHEIGIDMKYKMEKLKKGIDLSIPDQADSHEQCNIRAAVSCISELNKMTGDYAAIKQDLNINNEEDIRILEEEIEKNKKDY